MKFDLTTTEKELFRKQLSKEKVIGRIVSVIWTAIISTLLYFTGRSFISQIGVTHFAVLIFDSMPIIMLVICEAVGVWAMVSSFRFVKINESDFNTERYDVLSVQTESVRHGKTIMHRHYANLRSIDGNVHEKIPVPFDKDLIGHNVVFATHNTERHIYAICSSAHYCGRTNSDVEQN